MARTVAIGTQDFEDLREGEYFYIDKSYFIKEWWEAGDAVTVIMRPRRFGKSMALEMLAAYYSCGCDSRELFAGFQIESDETFEEHLNKYDVICDKIQFDAGYNVTLGYGGVKVKIGAMENLDEKIMQLPRILPSLAGEKGVLDLQNYSADKKTTSFEREG